MTDRSLIFSEPMVRALLEGRKTQTRRLGVKHWTVLAGDRIWVRENWRTLQKSDCLAPRHLGADISKITFEADPENRNRLWAFGKLRPSIHMPRWASRLTLIVEGVKIERLQDISEEDAYAEGVAGLPHEIGQKPRAIFAELWCGLHGPGSWDANQFVAAISFRVIKANIDSLPKEAAQ